MGQRDLVFVSYSHKDRPFCEQLRITLKPWMRRGLKYWADDYIPVGEHWKRVIDGAIERARIGVLLVSRDFLASDFIWEHEVPQLVAAAAAGELTLFCIPVSDSAYRATPLKDYQFAHPPGEPLDGLTEAARNGALVRIAEKIAAALEGTLAEATLFARTPRPVAPLPTPASGTGGALHGVPNPPLHFVPREAELAALKRALLEGSTATVGISGAGARVGIQGLGGIGKSVLAQALARDPDVRRAFPDGLYWVSLGQTPELVRLQNELAARRGVPNAGITEPFAGRDRLREHFGEVACLLVLDDLWQKEHAEPFDVLGPRGRLLVTTRDAGLLGAIGADTHRLDVLEPDAALGLLAQWTGREASALPSEARRVADQCGYLPLALALAAAQVNDGIAFAEVLRALEEGRLEFLDHQYGSVFASLGASVRALSEAEAARYRELSVVPEDTTMPSRVIARLWERTAGLRDYEAAKLLVRFAAKGLLYVDGEGDARAIRFHDLQLDYLTLVEAERTPTHHGDLLDAASERLPKHASGRADWAALPANERYLWRHLGHHFREAGRYDELLELARDVRWLEAKIAASGTSELLLELEGIAARAPDHPVASIERTLRVDGGWLHQDPSALQGLLYNRLRSDGLAPEAIDELVPGLAPLVRLRHPVRLDRGERRVFRGHSGKVTACAYSPDGTRILSASDDKTVREWDARTGKELRRFEGQSGEITACAYSPDGTRVLSASRDKTVREWDARTGAGRRRFVGHSSWVTACAYGPDGTRVLSASWDNTVREWDARTGAELRRFEGHSGEVTACAYSPDGMRVLSGSWDKTVREWDARTGAELRRFEGHSVSVTACTYSPDGTRVLSASANTVREWDARTGAELRRFEGHATGVTACTYSPDGTRVLSASADKTVREWDARTGAELRRFEGHSDWVTACAYSPDGTRILSASDDKTVREWDACAGNELRRFEGHSNLVTACAYGPDGTRVLSASWDNTVREWDARTGAELRRFEGHSNWVTACRYNLDGTRILSASYDNTVREWDACAGNELRRFKGHANGVTACTYSPDGTRVLSASHDKTVREWDARTGTELGRFEGHSDWVTACAYSPDGTRVLSASYDKTVREWDARTGKELGRFEGHSSWVTACAYSPDGTRVLSASYDKTVREWDARTGNELRRFEGHSSVVEACAYAAGDTPILSASYDNTLRLWSRTTGACVYTVYGAAAFTGLAVHGRAFCAGDAAGNLWHFDSDDALARLSSTPVRASPR